MLEVNFSCKKTFGIIRNSYINMKYLSVTQFWLKTFPGSVITEMTTSKASPTGTGCSSRGFGEGAGSLRGSHHPFQTLTEDSSVYS